MGKTNKFRLVFSAVLVFFWAALNRLLITAAPIVTGEAAVHQLDNSDTSYMVSTSIINGYPVAGMSSAFLLIALGWIWRKQIASGIKAILSIVMICLLINQPALAYYNVRDFPEFVEVGPNESAFMIPLTGANQTSQAKFGSVGYLQDNKVATKRVQVPHVAIRNPGWTYDYYVPSAKLVIVDRTAYNKQWTPKGTGTNASTDESMHTDTADGINISFSVTIAASVHEEDAATFLYNFGVRTRQIGSASYTDDEAKAAAAFESVSYGRSLGEVMDTVVHDAVQAQVNLAFGALKLNEVESGKVNAIKAVEKNIIETFARKGITIEFVGMASGINYDNPEVQKAMDAVVIADLRASAAARLTPTIPYQQAEAAIGVQNAIGGMLLRWNGVVPPLPTVVTNEATGNLLGLVKGMLSANSPQSR